MLLSAMSIYLGLPHPAGTPSRDSLNAYILILWCLVFVKCLNQIKGNRVIARNASHKPNSLRVRRNAQTMDYVKSVRQSNFKDQLLSIPPANLRPMSARKYFIWPGFHTANKRSFPSPMDPNFIPILEYLHRRGAVYLFWQSGEIQQVCLAASRFV